VNDLPYNPHPGPLPKGEETTPFSQRERGRLSLPMGEETTPFSAGRRAGDEGEILK